MASVRTVYPVEHAHMHDNGEEDVKTVGIYSSRENAEKAVERLRLQPGFRTTAQGFSIDPYTVDEDNWTEGFVTIGKDVIAEDEETRERDGSQ